MELEFSKAIYGLSAKGVPTGINVGTTSEKITIGTGQVDVSYTDSNVAYSLLIIAAADGNVATLTLSTGAVAQTTGSPQVRRKGTGTADLAGLDFEGLALPTLAFLHGVLFEGGAGTGGIGIACSISELPNISAFNTTAGQVVEVLFPDPIATPGTIAFTFAEATNYLTITVLGSTA